MQRVFFLVVWLVLLVGCGTPPFAPTATPVALPAPIVVYADAELSNVLRDIGTAFTLANPDGRIQWTFAEPDSLRAKLKQTPLPAVVISAADLPGMGVTKSIARDLLVVVVANANPAQLERAQDLNRSSLRVAIAKENSPLGQATHALIENFRHDAAFGPDFPAMFYDSLTVQADDGHGVLNAVIENRADVGIVYASQANVERNRTRILEIESGLNVPATYSVARPLTSRDAQPASDFIEYLHSPQAQTLLRDYGFEPIQ